MPNTSYKVVERLCQYRRLLQQVAQENRPNIFSHEIARHLHISPDTVRQDMRVLKYHGSPNAGYQVAELLEHLQRYLHVTAKNRVAIVGLGNLGKALLRYYKNKESFFSLEAAFELDESVVGRMILGTPCYHTSEITKIVEEKNITVGIIAVPATASQKVVDALVMGGVRGILMFTDMLVKVPEHVFVEYVDMTTLLETTIFFSRLS